MRSHTFYRCRYEGPNEAEIEEEWEVTYSVDSGQRGIINAPADRCQEEIPPFLEIESAVLVSETHEDGSKNEHPEQPSKEFSEYIGEDGMEKLEEEIWEYLASMEPY